jgi:hypothetical protein
MNKHINFREHYKMSKDLFNQLNGQGKDSAKQVQALLQSGISIPQLLTMFAPMITPVLDDLVSPANKAQIETAAQDAHAQLAGFGMPQAFMATMLASQVDRPAIEKAIQDFVDNKSDAQTVKASIALSKDMASLLPLDESIKLAQALRKTLPMGLKAYFDVASAKGNKTVPMVVKESRERVLNKSEAAWTAAMQYSAQNFPASTAADAVESILANLTPAALVQVVKDFEANVTPQDLSDLAINSIEFARDVCAAAENGNMFDLADTTNANKFAKSIKHVATVIENSLLAAGLVPSNAGQLAKELGQSRTASLAVLNAAP